MSKPGQGLLHPRAFLLARSTRSSTFSTSRWRHTDQQELPPRRSLHCRRSTLWLTQGPVEHCAPGHTSCGSHLREDQIRTPAFLSPLVSPPLYCLQLSLSVEEETETWALRPTATSYRLTLSLQLSGLIAQHCLSLQFMLQCIRLTLYI